MAHSITIRLNQAASVFQAGESTGFGLRGGVKYYDRDAKKEMYTNYEVAVFTSNANQVAYYQQALVEGAIVEISARNQRIKQFQGQNGVSVSIELLDAQLGLIAQGMPKGQNQGAQPAQQAPQQGGYQQRTTQQASQQGGYQQRPVQQGRQHAPQQGGYQHPQQSGGYQQDGQYNNGSFDNQ